MRISVVVCTRNRLDKLKRCVAAMLEVKTDLPWEFIIVDNGSIDGTADYLIELSRDSPRNFNFVTTIQTKIGLGAARNTGWRASHSEIVAFTDDDCYVAPDYVDMMSRAFNENEHSGFVAGRILLFDHRDAPVTIQESQERAEFPPWTFLAAGDVQGANLAFRRSALEGIGGFDERLGAGTPFPSEDIDAASAVLWAGIAGVYDPRPLVFHDHGRRANHDLDALTARYDAGRGAYFAKNVIRPETRLTYLKAWAGSIWHDCATSLPHGKSPARSIRELAGGLRFSLGSATAGNRQRKA
jgi:glycosyltransferase involved in cell wall biosynthesis